MRAGKRIETTLRPTIMMLKIKAAFTRYEFFVLFKRSNFTEN